MTTTIYEKINEKLTWKKILIFNLVLVLVLVVPLSVKLTESDTENRTNAAGEGVIVPSPIPVANYPKIPPEIERVNMFYGKRGDTILILGKNFGEYQWESKIYVGNVEVKQSDVIRWTNSILEIQIPESARTGSVWVAINGVQAKWEGSLLLYDVAIAAKIGIKPESALVANVWIEKGNTVATGMIEFSYVTEPIIVTTTPDITILEQTPRVDLLGKKMMVKFLVNQPLSRGKANLITITHPEIGNLEIIRAELKDIASNLIEVYSDPLSIKLSSQ